MVKTFLALAMMFASSNALRMALAPWSRRDVLSGVGLSVGGLAALPTPASAAVGSCKKGANNCVEGTWTGAKDAKDAAATLKSVLDAYPQAGQDGVDGGGWKYISSSDSEFKLEYNSAGTGNLAKFFNGGKPFTDDLDISINADGSVNFKSASRVGDSDFGVNGKRMTYIENALKEKGWN